MASWRYYYHHSDQGNSPLRYGPNNFNFVTLEELLIYCLDILKINDDESEIRRNAIEYIRKIPIEIVRSYGNAFLTVTKIIADFYAIYTQNCTDKYIFFSQSQVSDFLTLAAEGIGQKEENAKTKIDIIFDISRDILENYLNFDCILKSDYPNIIVDVILILHRGIDAAGKKVSLLSINEYYHSRKSRPSEALLSWQRGVNANSNNNYYHHHQIKDHQKQEQVIQHLIQITGRTKKELEAALAILHSSDIKTIRDLCGNYNKIEKYCKLVGSKGFRSELEREIGRRLSDNQVQSAALSIRKVRKYIENLLDGKFIPHDTHGINHIRHNLEYGFRVMDLIERKRKGSSSSS